MARTLCSNGSTGNFLCATGDCESGKIECPGRQYSWSPVTYLYFRIDIGGVSSYFISLEYGYNLPIKVVPSQTSPTCFSSGCMVDLKETCPEDLDLFDGGKQIGCVSACRRYDTPEICCSQEFKTKQKCKPTMYTRNFERACPFVYSYPYHDFTSTWTCPTSTDFVVTFCPSSVPNNTRISMGLEAGPKHNSSQKRLSRFSCVNHYHCDCGNGESKECEKKE
ncbi:unnamed protein product [Thlaspi arvense]|uniref:Thaumatin-like protein n=1 Tax=Thlaspi arvense TaxID=13288 RepID=A0AAU9T638_THLAR|nr:unnamed protein product [Thlaspi arvense]